MPELASYPEFACQPTSFRQSLFRDHLVQRPRIPVFKDAIAGFNTNLEMRFREGEHIRDLIYERAAFIDLILHYAWHQFQWQDDIALVAVGGYGRGELHPYSDIDLLILLDNRVGNRYNDQIQELITLLWDIGLNIGSSVRSIKECVSIAKQDISVVTNLMESRSIAGNVNLRATLLRQTGPNKMWSLDAFYKAKWEEQFERHNKHSDTEYNLEPNIKNAPGGLRDIQMISWVAKRFFRVQTIRQLEGKNFFTEHEFGILHSGEDFLWRVRYGIHMLSGRSEERLLFEYQRSLAKLFGYKDSDEGLAVEKFMRKYYRTAMALRELNDVLLQYLDEKIHQQHNRITPINDRFQLVDNYIEVTRPTIFDEYPSAILEIFVLMGNDPNILGVRAETIRLLRDKRWLINEDFRRAPENNRMFMALFSIEFGLVTQLTRMKTLWNTRTLSSRIWCDYRANATRPISSLYCRCPHIIGNT